MSDFHRVVKAKIGWILLIAVVVAVTSGAVYPILPRTYEATSLVLLQPTDQNGHPGFGHSTLNALDENQIQAYSDILASHALLQTVIQPLHLNDDPEFNPTLRDGWVAKLRALLPLPTIDPAQAVEINVRRHLVVRRDRKSYVMQVGFWADKPEVAAAMANTLANNFVADQLAHRQGLQRDLVAQLTAHAQELGDTYKASDAKAHDYAVETGLVHQDRQKSAQGQLATLSSRYADALSQAAAAEQHYQALAELQQRGALENAPDVLQSTVIGNLKERLITLTSNTGAPGTFARGSALPESLGELRGLIHTEVQRILKAAQVDANLKRQHATALHDEIAKIDANTVTWNEAERHWQVLQHVADADQKAWLDALAQSRVQSALLGTLRPDAVVYGEAIAPARPAFPNLTLYAVGTVLLILLLSGLAILPSLNAAPRRVQAIA